MLAVLSALTLTALLLSPTGRWLESRAPDHELITLSDGLSDSTIYSIDQDSQGRIWFGTASGGVNVFDGHHIRAFIHEPRIDSLSHSDAGQVFVDSKGTVFVGTWGGGLNRLISPEGRFERINPESSPLRIQTLFEDLEGRIWVGASGDGLMLFDGESSFVPVPRDNGQPLDRVWGLAQSPDQRLWVASSAGLFELDGATLKLTLIDALGDDHPRALAATADHLWIGGNSGLYSMDLDLVTIRRLPLDLPTINVVRSTPDERLLVGSLAGLFAVEPESGSLIPPVGGGQLRLFPDRNIRAIDFDGTGMIWLGTREAGVIKLNGGRTGFEGYTTDELLETVDTLVELAPDELLIGSRRGLWRLHASTSGPKLEQVAGSEPYFVNQLVKASDRVLVGTRSGLKVYDPATRTLASHPAFSILEGVSITVIYPAPDESLWVGTWSQGLYHLPADGGEMIRYWTGGSPALPDDYLSVIEPDPNGGLLLGHWYEGLSRLTPETGELERFRSSRDDLNALPIGHLHSVIADRHAIWVGTSFGFARFDLEGRKVTRIPIAREDLPTSVQRLEFDREGNIWIASTRGIKRLNPSTGRLVHYGSADGLVATEFYARSGARGEDGRIYFGGVGGVVSLDPMEVEDRFPIPEVFVTEVSVDGSLVPLVSGKIEVAPGTRELRFSFTAADFKNPKENRYQYRMLGESPEWSPIGLENDASFAALPAGRYQFEVRAGNSNGVWNHDSPANVQVHVLPFWWQTWPGRFGLCLVFAMFVFGWNWIRTRRIRAANRRLEAEVARQTRDLQLANQRLAQAAATDFLTGLPNRRGFYAELESDEGTWKGTVALADVDDFKVLNDRFGHDLGDLVLKNIADAMASAVRPQDLIARWGGEEFIIFFTEIDLDQAEIIAERVRASVELLKLDTDLENRPISVTLGIAERKGQEPLDQCIDRADQGLYIGKQTGKNQVVRAA